MESVLSELEMQEAEVVFEGGSPASVLSFLQGSDCLTVLPETTVAEVGSQFGIQAVPIQVRTPRRSLGILSRSPRELDNTSRTFVRFLEDHFRREGRDDPATLTIRESAGRSHRVTGAGSPQ